MTNSRVLHRIIPQSLEAEMCVLGSMIIDPATIDKVCLGGVNK